MNQFEPPRYSDHEEMLVVDDFLDDLAENFDPSSTSGFLDKLSAFWPTLDENGRLEGELSLEAFSYLSRIIHAVDNPEVLAGLIASRGSVVKIFPKVKATAYEGFDMAVGE